MASSHSQNRTLRALVIFQNFLYPEMIRSVHAYRSEGGGEEIEEREFLLHERGNFEESGYAPVITLYQFDVYAQYVGMVNGVWKCMFVYNSDRHQHTGVEASREWLSIAEDPRMNCIPTLANDIRAIPQFKEPHGRPTETAEESVGNNIKSQQLESKSRVPFLDLNSLPDSDLETEEKDQNASENQKRARLALEDVAKYFDVPILEASKSLKVGLTVLKKKCREFGIHRWPHRKIKSLDNLLRDLQEEMQWRQEEDELAAMELKKRKRTIENERESIEKKPFMDIKEETKKFRQDIFKRRHKARALENKCRTLPHLPSINQLK